MSEGQVKNASKLLEEASKNSKNREKVLDALLAAVNTAESAGLQGAQDIAKDDPALEGKVKEFQEITSETANIARGKILSLREGDSGPKGSEDGWESSAGPVPPMHHGPRWHGPRGRLAALHGMTNSLMVHVNTATTQINNPAQLKIIIGIIQLLIRQVNTLATRTNELGKRMGRLEEKLKLPLTPSLNIPLLSEQHAPQQYSELAYKRWASTAPEVSSPSASSPEAAPKGGPAANNKPNNSKKTNTSKPTPNASKPAKANANAKPTPNGKPAANDSKGKPANNKPKQGNTKPAVKLTRRNRSQRRLRRSRRQP